VKEFGLQRIWEKLAFQPHHLVTDNGQPLQIINQGEWNNQNGPDFLNAEIVVNGIHCFGSIEIHVKASDWYAHNHHQDPRYNGVILHVVWQNDRPCFTEGKDPIPCISIKSRVSKLNLTQFNFQPTLPCNQQIQSISASLLSQQLHIAACQRSESKIARIMHAHNQLNQDWWLTASYAFMSAWIGKANQHHCIDLCKNIKKSIILRATSEKEIVAYLLGIGGLLNKSDPDSYIISLIDIYKYQKEKFDLHSLDFIQWNNRQVRPSSFASIRMAQFGSWLFTIKGELSQFFNLPNSEYIDKIGKIGFQSNLSEYWDKHYELGNPSERHNPNNGKEHAQKVVLNGLIPLWNTLAMETHKPEFHTAAKRLLNSLPSESNATIKKMHAFSRCKQKNSTAEWSQSLIAQYQLFCKPLKCAQCLIGDAIINVPFMKQDS